MRIGILADIHDAVGPLRNALDAFKEKGVGMVVTLGDTFESFRPGSAGVEVATLLQDAGAVGVWGNHDVGLSHDVSAEMREMADPAILAFAAGLRAQLVLEGCRFSHIAPWRDPNRLQDLWTLDDPRDSAGRTFGEAPERIMFMGHIHSWLVVQEAGGWVDWDETRSICLTAPHRYLVVVGPVLEGWCATFDTDSSELTPLRCSD